jgi:hypothetical protein
VLARLAVRAVARDCAAPSTTVVVGTAAAGSSRELSRARPGCRRALRRVAMAGLSAPLLTLLLLALLPPLRAGGAEAARQPQPRQPAQLQLVLDPGSAPPLANGANFWTAGPRGFNSNATLVPPLQTDVQRLGEAALLAWDGAAGARRTQPLMDTATTVRILGGWAPRRACQAALPVPGCVPAPDAPPCCSANGTRVACCPPVAWHDIAFRQPDGSTLGYRWSVLWQRLDPLVNNSIHPIVVLDNVDYTFVKNASIGKT